MKKLFTFNEKRETVEESSAKRSIMLRWAFANTVFCFITFTLFATLTYQLTISAFMREEQRILLNSMDSVEEVLEEAKGPLNSTNLKNYIEYPTKDRSGDSRGLPLTSLVGSREAFYIYDVNHELLHGTSHHVFGFQNQKNNDIKEIQGENPGFLVQRRIISESTGQVVGYLQAFYDITTYHRISNLLLIVLLILEIVALIIAQIIGYFMANYFMKPLEKLHQGMQKMANDPKNEFEAIEITSGDEIEELANVYNDMMHKMKNYLDQQKRFVSDVSHELRTPLAVLDGHINLLNRWGKNDPEVLDESLQASLDEVARMKKMLEEMLALARLENVDLSSEDLDCDVAKVCDHAVKNFSLIHEDFKIVLNNQLDYPVHARISENHFEQGLRILLDNAVKYSPDDRKVVKIRISEDEKFVITRVSDQGIGIGQEDIDHLFERFFRADKARNREIGGTGLGLSILARLAENYQGEIEVSSELGVGSTFTLKFPKID
ncbi:HAMP domain-containing sensor histidine kinase [Lactococcus kimchii]|uniref:HAMP domain-containing sensor histidine kinase n=1 Tax=Lactococcus sp. S-13 TaxID=2507158 RepID=UPI001022BB37|nr:HAMP domain-containing histidine kinase [Lactococcus sp. S-13]RZI48803.1 HAMP domain-containing histidine kinase [Lactococcus sp. S-13]